MTYESIRCFYAGLYETEGNAKLLVDKLVLANRVVFYEKPETIFFGKEVFIGIDVHKTSYSVVAQVDQTVAKKWTTPASPRELSQQLIKYFDGATIHSVYEAGFSGFALHQELVKHGIDNIVVHAASIEVAANNRVKTDRRDAQKMAALLEAGRLKGNRIPSEQQEQRRMLTRTRQQLVEDRFIR